MYCPRCGEMLSDEWRFCKKCGKELKGTDNISAASEKAEISSEKSISVIQYAGLLLLNLIFPVNIIANIIILCTAENKNIKNFSTASILVWFIELILSFITFIAIRLFIKSVGGIDVFLYYLMQ